MALVLGTGVAAAGSTGAASTVNHTLTAGTLGNRKVYVAATYEFSTGGTPPSPSTWTYGGVSVTPHTVTANVAGGFEQTTRIGYVLEADLPADGVNAAVYNQTTDSGPQGLRIFCWAVEGVAQVAATAYTANAATGSVDLGPYDAAAGAVGSLASCANGQTFTLNASWNEFGDGSGQAGDASGTGGTKEFGSAATAETVTVTLSAAGRQSGIAIIDAPVAAGPTVTDQPDNATAVVTPSTPAVFTAVATTSGTSLSEQWYRGASGTTSNPISTGGVYVTGASGTTTRTLTLTVTPTDTSLDGETYWVRITDSDGSVDSDDATLTVADGDVLVQPVGVTNGSGVPATSSGSLTSDLPGLTRLVATVGGVALDQVVVITKR